MRPHTFLPDSAAVDRPGGDPHCAACGMPRKHRSHVVEEMSDDARELAARIVGETVHDDAEVIGSPHPNHSGPPDDVTRGPNDAEESR